jgi:hypothetical protein
MGAYFDHNRSAFGAEVFENNVTPYDMVHRVGKRHLEFLARKPILAVLEGASTLVTHAGPPKMAGVTKRALRRQIEQAAREDLGTATAEAYYASAYHQLLNNRFRAKDYELLDVEEFLKVFSSSLLVTGHTPHPYLIDYARQGPLEGCEFRDGLGLIGQRQVVLCTSFGAFDDSRKRYIELDLARPYASALDLRSGQEILPLYPDAPKPEQHVDETAQIIKALAKKPEPRRTAAFDPRKVAESAGPDY